MGGKHKKFLRSEKAKVKLKGIKLPKGLNVTKTEFKVKKIVLREQLQEEKFESGKKKYNVKEVLSRLKHHNASFRAEALKNLRECLSYDSNEILRNLGEIVQGIALLSLDIEKEIRRHSYKVFSDLFSIFNLTALEPFFNMISSYLKCAMSHINHGIQEDSLLFLDVLLTYLPGIIMQNYNQIFLNFLDMISKLRCDSKPGRMLTINVGNKTTTIKWRSKILDRLQRMLEIVVEDWKLKSNAISESKYKPREVYVNDQTSYLSVYNTSVLAENFDSSNLFNKSLGQYELDNIDDGEKTKKYIECLLPLLFESWMEVRPNFSNEESIKSQIILSNEAAVTLKIILEILESLWEMVKIWEHRLNMDFTLSTWFQKKFASEFTSKMFSKFPYQQFDAENSNDKKKKKEIVKNIQLSGGSGCLKLNMILIYIYNIFYGSNIVKHQEFTKAILKYLHSVIERLQVSVENLPSFEKALKSTIFSNGRFFIQVDKTKYKSLIKSVIDQYRNDKFPKSFSPNILALLCEIVLSRDNLLSTYGQNEFSSFLTILPLMLSKETISLRVLKTLTNLGKQKNELFLKSLGKQVEDVIENIEKIQVSECVNVFEGRKLIINLFYWIDFWDQDFRYFLIDKINKNITNKDLSGYFNFIIEKSYN